MYVSRSIQLAMASHCRIRFVLAVMVDSTSRVTTIAASGDVYIKPVSRHYSFTGCWPVQRRWFAHWYGDTMQKRQSTNGRKRLTSSYPNASVTDGQNESLWVTDRPNYIYGLFYRYSPIDFVCTTIQDRSLGHRCKNISYVFYYFFL